MKQAIQIEIIGRIRSKFPAASPADARLMKKEISYIDIDDQYAGGLYKIEQSQFIDVVFNFHLSKSYQIKTHTYSGDYKGVFATRSPERPSMIGVTTVELLERQGNILKVTGLDAVDGTPVVDIKASDTHLLQQNLEKILVKRIKTDPRKDIYALILANNTEILLLKAGQMHGHFCPGLAMGIMAATHAMNLINGPTDGLEDILAIVENNNCMCDGIQFVTGCSFGNNALVFKDLGKMAFTLAKRDGKGVRISARTGSKEYMRKAQASFGGSYTRVVKKKERGEEATTKFKSAGIEAALNTLKLDFDKIFKVEEVEVEIPAYAPSHESIICCQCGEEVMSSRVIKKMDKSYCMPCAGVKIPQLTGDGIDCSE